MQFLEIRSKVKNHHISEAGVSFEIQFDLFIKIWDGEHIFYVWQETIALNYSISCFPRIHCSVPAGKTESNTS